MNNSNLWPTRAKLFDLGDDAPNKILEKQAEYINSIDPVLTGRVVSGIGLSPATPLSSIIFPTDSITSTFAYSHTAFSLTNSFQNSNFAFALIVGNIAKIFTFELLRIKFNAMKYYPVEVIDTTNDKSYTLYDETAYTNCLRGIFNSEKCMERLRYMIMGPII